MSIMFDKDKGKLFQNQLPVKKDSLKEELLALGTYVALEDGEPCMMNVLDQGEQK